MHRLNGLEAFFLYQENDSQNSNTGCLMRLQPDDPTQPITLAALRSHVAERLDTAPVLRWHVRSVPLGLHHSVLVDDPGFNLDHHLSDVVLDDPADDATMRQVFATATAQRFNPKRPMWRMDLVTLRDGSQAIFFIFHHVLMDGVAYLGVLEALFTDTPTLPPFTRPYAPVRLGRGALLARSFKDMARVWGGLPRLFRDTRTGRNAMAKRIAETAEQVPPIPATRLPINPAYAPSSDRLLALADLPFADVRAVRQAGEVSINTVLLAVVAISLRRHLLEKGLLPDEPLIAGVMASLEPLDPPPRPNGNLFANFLVSTATDLEDPWAQMQSINLATAEGKVRLEALGIDIGTRLFELFPPILGRPVIWLQDRQQKASPPKMRSSFAFSNVRGASSYHFLGSSVRGLYTFGPLGDAIGIFVAVTNMADLCHVSIMTNKAALSETDELAARFGDTLADLVALAGEKEREKEEGNVGSKSDAAPAAPNSQP